jgi:hypothetical protein
LITTDRKQELRKGGPKRLSFFCASETKLRDWSVGEREERNASEGQEVDEEEIG